MISLRARLLRYFARKYFARISPDSNLADLRESFEAVTARLGMPGGVQVRHATIAGIDCDWLVPAGAENAPVLYYLHGGAYVMGSSRTHRHLVAHIARAAGLRALLPNYRLAPEHPFPAGIEDACAVYRALLAEDLPAGQIAIAGDSAGGGLAVATLLTLRDGGDALPAAAVLLSPWLDLTGSGESFRSRAGRDPLFRPADMPATADYYCDENLRDDPRVSPVFAEPAGLPPVFIQVGDLEILLSDSTRFADKLSAAGIPVTLQVWPGMWHVFQFLVGQMPEARAAINDIAAYLRKVVAS